MQQIWVIVVVLVIFLLVLRLRGKRKGLPEAKIYARRIEGTQIVATLHPRVSAACLADHGLQFGKGFRRKEGPALPHDGECRCEERYFSITSTEVFHGALRRGIAPRTSIASLPEPDRYTLLETLLGWEGAASAESADQALARTDLTRFSESARQPVEMFLRERFAYLAVTRGARAPQPA